MPESTPEPTIEQPSGEQEHIEILRSIDGDIDNVRSAFAKGRILEALSSAYILVQHLERVAGSSSDHSVDERAADLARALKRYKEGNPD